MVATILLIAAILVAWGLGLVLNGCALWLGLKLTGISPVKLGKVALATLLIGLFNLVISVGLMQFETDNPQRAILLLAMSLIAVLASSCFIISKIFHASAAKSFLAWLATLVPLILMVLLAAGVIKPYVAEAFYIPTNSMAPTLLGVHCQAVCPKCGAPAYFSPPFEFSDSEKPEPRICANFHVTEDVVHDSPTFGGDRILVAKFLQPRRWDLVAFRYPENPSYNFVKRLVGLPGETIVIKEGKVYADGKLLTLPAELQGIEYATKMPYSEHFPPVWGSEERPAKLGHGEYFVLGDFSIRARDSRMWEKGAYAHPPYAVPEANLIGVVTQIYWPLMRYRTFR